MNANLYELFRRNAEAHPDLPAFFHQGRRITYGELLSRVKRRAGKLSSCGITKGDRTVVFVPMSIALYEILLSVFSIGATAVFLDAWADARRLDHAAEIADAKAFIAIPKAWFLLLRSRALRRIPVRLPTCFGCLSQLRKTSFSPAECLSGDPALITFTTGSTGIPKAALRTCGFLLAQHHALAASLDIQPGDVDLATLPIFALNNLACGVSTLIPDFNPARPSEFDPIRMAREAAAAGVTTSTASPAFYRRLAEAAHGGLNPIPTLRSIHVGGAAVFPEFAAELVAAFPGTRVNAIYGSTEAEPIAAISAEELVIGDATLGIPAGTVSPFIEPAIIPIGATPPPEMTDEAWRSLQVASGEAGEICVAGDHVLTTYFRNPEAVLKNKIRVGDRIFHRTGDAGRLCGGKLFLLGRASRVFRTRDGIWCYPAQVERILAKLRASSAGTLLRRPDGAAILFLESTDTAGAKAEAETLDRSLVPFDGVCVLPRLPRDPRHASKIDYAALAKCDAMTSARRFTNALTSLALPE